MVLKLLAVIFGKGLRCVFWTLFLCEMVEQINVMLGLMEWSSKSGTLKSFPEIDKAQWFTVEEALEKIPAAGTVA